MAATIKTWEYVFADGCVTWPGGRCDFSPEEAVIFGLLDKAFPHKVSGIIIKNNIWPIYTPDADLPEGPGNAISALMTHMRRRLEKAGAPFQIPHADYHGYWLENRT